MKVDPTQGESRLRRMILPGMLAVSVLLLLVVLFLTLYRQTRPLRVRIATGVEGGTYSRIGQAIANLANETLPNASAETVHTNGSPENIDLLLAGEVELAFVQNNAAGDDRIRTVARLYDEVMQILVRTYQGEESEDVMGTFEALRGKPIFLGEKHSGTAITARKILKHYGLDLDGAPEAYIPEHAMSDRVAAAFFLAGLPTGRVTKHLAGEEFRLLSLGEPQEAGSRLEGLCFELPGMKPAVIPAHTYGRRPGSPVGSVAVEALLVTRADIPDYQIRKLTELLFEKKFSLVQEHPAIAEMSEITHSKGLRFPLHPGAANFYARNEPPFVVTYAETLSLLFTLLISLFSGIWALRGWRRKKRKDRIDEYYLRVDGIAREITEDLPRERLRTLRTELAQLRRRAFHDLVAERIEADESFTIFQDFLGQQLLDIQQLLERHRASISS